MGQRNGVVFLVIIAECVKMSGKHKFIGQQARIDFYIEAEVEVVAMMRPTLISFGEIFDPRLGTEVLPGGIVFPRSTFVVIAAVGHLVATVVDIAILAPGVSPLPGTAGL